MTQQEQMYRTEILLTAAQHRALAELAVREGRSVAEVLRELVAQQLEQRQADAIVRRERRLAVLAEIQRHREEILAENGGKPLDFDAVAVINWMREERDARNLGLR